MTGAARSGEFEPGDIAIAPIGGFWVRLLAHFVDLVVWGFTCTILAVALVYVAPNTFGLASALPALPNATTAV